MQQKTVKQMIHELIDDDGYHSLNTVPDSQVEELLGLYIREMGDNGYEAIVEPEELYETVNDFIGYLLKGTTESAVELAETMRNNARQYLSKSLETLFDDMYADIYVDRQYEAGLHPVVDSVNGEVRWVR